MHQEKLVGQVLGHYRIKRLLGYGGTARVFLADDINLQREVAIKVFQPKGEETQDFLRRFAREARVLARLDHPNILSVYDYGEQQANAYLVMPYMMGGSLRERLQQQKTIPPLEALHLINQILNALQYAHERGLIHRDIKPGNMLFKADGTLFLSDFGLVKVLPTEGNLAQGDTLATLPGGSISGTPDYMAPEQINGKAVPASDIYATGVVLYEMLTGFRPFTADNFVGILMKHLNERPRLPREINPTLSPELEAVIMHALEKDPARRYQSPSEMQQALIQALGNEQRLSTLQNTRFTSLPPSFPGAPNTPSQPGISGSQSDLEQYATTPQAVVRPNNQPVRPVTYPQPSMTSQIVQAPEPSRRSKVPLVIALVLVTLALVVSVGSIVYGPGRITQLLFPQATASPHVEPTATSTNGAITTMDCPAAGKAQFPFTPEMPQDKLGNHQNLVYLMNTFDQAQQSLAATIERRDISAPGNPVTEINTTKGMTITDALISNDGQWVLFAARVQGQYQLRMVRIDGQYPQTLYCAPSDATIENIQWSFDQKNIVFNQGQPNTLPTIYLLNTQSGTVQTELIPPHNLGYVPRVWKDATRLYMTSFVPASNTPQQDIYLLNVQNGPDQHDANLQKVATQSFGCGSFDSSVDGTQVFVSNCTNDNAPTGPSTITALPLIGDIASTPKIIYSHPTSAITTVRTISMTTLLFFIENASGDQTMNGLWKISADGKGTAMRLSTDTNHAQSLCSFSQDFWTDISRDKSMFALQYYDPKANEYRILYGSLNGGGTSTLADMTNGTQLLVIGWTKM